MRPPKKGTAKSPLAEEVQRRLSFSSDGIAQENVASAPTVDTNPDCDLEMRQPKAAKGKEPANEKEPNSVPEVDEQKEAVSQEGSGRHFSFGPLDEIPKYHNVF